MIISERFLQENNKRILSSFEVQARYVLHKKKKPGQLKLTDNIREWLRKVYPFQYRKTITEICDVVRTPHSTGSRINKAAEKLNLIKVLTHGRNKYPIWTEEAYATLGEKSKKFYGRGAGDYHVFYQHRIQEHFIDLKPVIELQRNGKFIDVAIQLKDSPLVCIEIAMTSKNERNNIEKCHEVGGSVIVVACNGDPVAREVKAIVFEMNEEVRNKALICTLSDLLKMEPRDFLKSLGRSQ
jgi:hypothetical protein